MKELKQAFLSTVYPVLNPPCQISPLSNMPPAPFWNMKFDKYCCLRFAVN